MRSTFTNFRTTRNSSSGSSNKNSSQHRFFIQETPRKPREKMSTIYRHKYYDKPFYVDPSYNNFNENPQVGIKFFDPLRTTRKDSQVEKERTEMLIKTGYKFLFMQSLMSSQNPEWMKRSYHQYKKSNFSPPSKQQILEQKNYDILNNPKSSFTARRHQEKYYRDMIKEQMNVAEANRSRSQFNKSNGFGGSEATTPSKMERKLRSTLNWTMQNQRDVSPKVGSLPVRDYTIKKPLLKITNPGSFVDTYSPWEKF